MTTSGTRCTTAERGEVFVGQSVGRVTEYVVTDAPHVRQRSSSRRSTRTPLIFVRYWLTSPPVKPDLVAMQSGQMGVKINAVTSTANRIAYLQNNSSTAWDGCGGRGS